MTISKEVHIVTRSLAMKLRVLRAERQLSLRQASTLTGVDKVSLSRFERGIAHPQDRTLGKLAAGYGVPVEELLEEPVTLGDAPPERGPASLEEERPKADSPTDPQRWEQVLASVRERQSNVTAKVNELVETSAHSGEVDLHQVKRALDEAQGFQFTLMRAMSGASSRHSSGRVELVIPDPFAPEFDPAQWNEVGNAVRFYNDIVDRLVKAGLAEWKERAGQKRELVPVGS